MGPNIDARAVAVGPGNSVNNQTAQLVSRFPLFSAMPLEECAKMIALAQLRNFERGKAIFFEGEPIRQVVLLTSGCVKLSQLGAQGQEVILRIIGPGETLCVQCFPKFPHCSTATAIKQSVALVWESKQFECATESFPILRHNVSCIILQTLNQLEVRFREVSTGKVASRLSSQLLRLLSQVGKESDGYVDIALSQSDLADLMGTTLFTVNRLLSQWEDQGIVIYSRESMRVLNVPALTEISQGD